MLHRPWQICCRCCCCCRYRPVAACIIVTHVVLKHLCQVHDARQLLPHAAAASLAVSRDRHSCVCLEARAVLLSTAMLVSFGHPRAPFWPMLPACAHAAPVTRGSCWDHVGSVCVRCVRAALLEWEVHAGLAVELAAACTRRTWMWLGQCDVHDSAAIVNRRRARPVWNCFLCPVGEPLCAFVGCGPVCWSLLS